MKTLRKIAAIILVICILVPVNSIAISAYDPNPYPLWQDFDGDGYSEIRCTHYAWQYAYDNLGIQLPSWGQAYQWYSNAKAARYLCDSTPSPNSIAVWSAGNWGHVAYVTKTSGGNTFTINEGGRVDLDQTSSHGVKTNYTITNAVGQSRPYNNGLILLGFIHLKSGSSSNPPQSNVKTYTITYNANGGSGAPAQQTKTQGVSMQVSSKTPTRNGYTFLGWSRGANDTNIYVKPNAWISWDGSQTLYAQWKKANVTYFPRYYGSSCSIVDGLKAVGADSSYSYRSKIAARNGISGYAGTASQNTKMLNLLKQGKLIKP